jgi:ParB family chromosome partitioning protein
MRTVPAHTVKAEGDHLFWASEPDEALADSIREFGQIAPVLARDTDNGMELVAGYRRLRVLREQDSLALARMVDAPTPADLGLLYLADNSQRVLTDPMRLAALRYFRPLMDGKTLASDVLPRLGVKPKSKDARLLLAWLDLDGGWQDRLDRGCVPLAGGEVLARMDPADREAVAPLFDDLAWSRSSGVNVLTWLFEAGKMAGTPLAQVLDRAKLTEILGQGLSPKDAIARLTAAARLVRYPHLSALREDFDRAAREITAGTGWRLAQPNNFETGGAELSIQVRTPEQLAKAARDLETMAPLSPWDTLWNLGGKNE